MISKKEAPQQIADSVFWLGSTDVSDFLQINIYLIYRNGMGIVIDPGPRNIFKQTLKAVREIAPLEDIKALVASNQDPDICSSLPLWEEAGFQGDIVNHWRTGLFIASYGLFSPLYNIREPLTPSLEDLSRLQFVSVPYLHSPGTLLSYDPVSGTLFSSDLFGAFGKTESLIADDVYLSKMTAYHNNYMPSAGYLPAVLDRVRTLEVKRICPQHGCIIESEPERHIDALRDFISSSTIKNNPADNPEDDRWEAINFDLNEELVLSSDEKLLDPVTGLYKAAFFENFLPEFLKNNSKGTLSYFRMDGMKSFNNSYGYQEGDRAISTFASIMQESKPAEAYLFRESGPILILMLPESCGGSHIDIIEQMQNNIRESGDFIEQMTCSASVVDITEVDPAESGRAEMLIRKIRNRLQVLDSMGPHSICNVPAKTVQDADAPSVMIIDADPISSQLLSDFFSHKKFTVSTCSDGAEALRKIDLNRPDIIISEMLLPQMDGVRLREQLLQAYDLRNIPFIFLKTEESVKKAQHLGVLFNFKKPVMLPELYGVVKSLIRDGENNVG